MTIAAAEPIRLVIWDLDETFWHGTLTEGGIHYRRDVHDMVVTLARRGIVSSICSKNDEAPVREILQAHGIWDYFILPSISWDAKGPRIAALVEAIGLRPSTVLFIDDNRANLAEAHQMVPGLQVALPEHLDHLLDHPRLTGRPDPELTRLARYRLLQRRHQEAARAPDNIAFLRDSQINIAIDLDVDANLDRAIELINRTNQLNFTKQRLPEDTDAARAALQALLAHPDNQGALVHVRDRFGDHGHCGFYVIRNSRADAKRLLHFAFSCRILGMGVETWLYRRLGRPAMDVVGDVMSDPIGDTADIDWIEVAKPAIGAIAATPLSVPPLDVVYLRGACHVRPMSHFFAMVSHEVVEGFDTTRHGRTMPLHHSVFADYAIRGIAPAAREAFKRLGYVDEDFTSFIATAPANQRGLWLLNFWTEIGSTLYRHRPTGALIPVAFAPEPAERMKKLLGGAAADARNWDPAAAGVDDGIIEQLRDSYDFVGAMPDDLLLRNMMAMIRHAPKGTRVFMLLANDMRLTADGTQVLSPRVKAINNLVRDAARRCPRAALVDVKRCIKSDDELVLEQPLKLHRAVYFRVYEEIMRKWETREKNLSAA